MPDTAAPVYELIIPQGATLTRTFVWKDADGDPIDLTDYSARLQVREAYDDPYPVLDVTSESEVDGTLIITEATGTIVLTVPADVTAALDFDGGVWDLEVEDADGVVTRLVQGACWLDLEATQ